MTMNALIEPIIVPIKQALRKLVVRIIFDSATFNKIRTVKTARTVGKKLAPCAGDRKLVETLPATTTA